MNPITAIVQRNLLNYIRSKGRVFGALFMSMFMLVMFSFLMRSAMSGLDAPMPYLISGVIIMDEPTSGLDPYERIKFRNIISAYAKDRLVLLSTHIVSDVEHIAAQIMMMKYGDIQHIHTSGEYIRQMKGRVWLAEMPAEQLMAYQNQAVISNVRAKDGRMEVRIISDTKPAPDAVQAVPTLEDAYLYLFNYLPGKAGR